MSRHSVLSITNFQDQAAFERFTCIACSQLLEDPVQVCCGDRFCKTCADEILAKDRPVVCPECGEELVEEEDRTPVSDRWVVCMSVVQRYSDLHVYCDSRSRLVSACNGSL